MRYLTSLLISIVAHTLALGLLAVLPLLFFNVVQAEELITFLIEPPHTPVPPPQPVPPPKPRAVSGRTVFRGGTDRIPVNIPNGILPADDSEQVIDYSSLVDGIGRATEGVPSANVISRLLEATRQPELPQIEPPKTRTPIRVSGRIQEARLINKINPVYPELAIRARVSGTVTLEALIDEEGSVAELKILNGHNLLRDAAYDAVKQWKYLPTMIGGEPVPVVAVVTVIFRFR